MRALESVLAEKGYIDPAALDALVDTYETRSARATAPGWWPGPGPTRRFAQWLLRTPPRPSPRSGFTGRQGEHMVAVENTPEGHNMVVCTLCSCYPWPVLACRRSGTSRAPYRSRAVIDPRGVLADFGVDVARHRDPGVGLDRRGALPGDPDAARRHRRLERGAARRPGHPRLDDRHRTRSSPGQVVAP